MKIMCKLGEGYCRYNDIQITFVNSKRYTFKHVGAWWVSKEGTMEVLWVVTNKGDLLEFDNIKKVMILPNFKKN